MRQRGTPMQVTSAELADLQAHLKGLHGRGMSAQAMARQTAIHSTSIDGILSGRHTKVHRTIYNRLMQAKFEAPLYRSAAGRPTGSYQDSTGTRRRVRALQADGFPLRLIAAEMGVSLQAVSQLANKEGPVYASTAARVAEVYDKWLITDPRKDLGVGAQSYSRTKMAAERAGYPPRGCWDPDTIDDPDAFPEWTGECGTPAGDNLHRKYGIPVCDPCRLARNAYRMDRKRKGHNA